MDMTGLPPGAEKFLQQAGWADADVSALPGDASFRRYYRLRRGADKAMLMFAPPPEEDPQPFLHAAHWLAENGLRAPQIFAQDAGAGLVLQEDFGDQRVREWLELHPQDETAIYRTAIDTLITMRDKPPGPFAPYDLETYLGEVDLLTEWFCPAHKFSVADREYRTAWAEVLQPLVARQQAPVTVLRDYHAENIMLIDPQPKSIPQQGLIDFQDALVGHPAYDLVSLLQDARRDVSPELESEMLEYYVSATGTDPQFKADYAALGAQRNAKIVGIFVRLARRDGKRHYLDFIPRVWRILERDLQHEALAPVARWFDANIPHELRAANGGSFA